MSAVRRLARCRSTLSGKGYEVIIIDEKDNFEFIPMLPDLIGGWLGPDRLRRPISELASETGCRFVRDRIEGLDPVGRTIRLAGQTLNYEYLIISTGSCTNFFNNETIRTSCRKIDNIDDALNIKKELEGIASRKSGVNAVIVGGGYTGIEAATNIIWLFRKMRPSACRVVMVEKAPDILVALPEWMRIESRRLLERLGVEICCADSLKSYDGTTALLESGRALKSDICIWTAGVKTADYLDGFNARKERTRIMVGPYLTVEDPQYGGVFAAGDAASFVGQAAGQPIRMAVMFSMGQGKVAAENVIRRILNRPLVEYKVMDLGYIIPMAQGKGPGVVMGLRVRGLLGYLLHYCMCIYRSEWKNKPGIIMDLISKAACGGRITKRRLQ